MGSMIFVLAFLLCRFATKEEVLSCLFNSAVWAAFGCVTAAKYLSVSLCIALFACVLRGTGLHGFLNKMLIVVLISDL